MKDLRPECKDCRDEGITTHRLARKPGPRCETHWRAFRKGSSERAHERHVASTFGLAPGEYAAILAAQNGLCAMCGPYTGRSGKTKRLATDHDHKCCPGKTSCGKCVRGLLCGICNDYLGKIGDNPFVFVNAIKYLNDPPARRVLGRSE